MMYVSAPITNVNILTTHIEELRTKRLNTIIQILRIIVFMKPIGSMMGRNG